MSDTWRDLAVAVASRIEFERRCDRLGFVDEFTAVRFSAEFLDSQRTGKIRTEEPHPDISNKFIDLVRETKRGKQLDLGMEAKWLRPTGSTRSWLKELAVDLFRLQHFRTGTKQGTHRVLLVVGTHDMIKDNIFDRNVQTGGGSKRGLPFILPENLSTTFTKFEIRNCRPEARKWLRSCRVNLGVNLPSTYDARLAARHVAASDNDAIEAVVWVTRRKPSWKSFDDNRAWGVI
ncbi:MAG: hypothetical protein IH944_13790 [Armatimonadetes bacterium]|nr:hypothetical protein [Armatimonadota bacterium]